MSNGVAGSLEGNVPNGLGGNTVAFLGRTQTFTGTNTFTGSLRAGNGTGSPQIDINGAAATNKGVNFKNAGVNRWRLLTDASEGMNLYAYDAAGAFLDTAWNATQSTAVVTFNYKLFSNNSYAPIAGAATGTYLIANNIGANAAYGHLVQYSSVAGGAGFDTGFGVISTYNPTFIGAQAHNQQAIYFVAESANDTTHTWGGNIGEMNFVNRGLDVGFKRSREDAGNNTGGLLFVPESIVLSGGAGEGKNVTYGYSVARSGAANSTGFPVKSYTGYLVEPNAIVGLTGRGSYMTGDITSTASQRPYGPIQTDGTWLHGIDHTLATYIDGHSDTYLVGQGLAWVVGTTAAPTATATIAGSGSGSDASLTLTPAGTGAVNLASKVTIPTQTPASAAATGTTGQIAWDASFIYICTATNTWKRVAIATW